MSSAPDFAVSIDAGTVPAHPMPADVHDVQGLRRENAQLRHALESRILIEQAKGVLAERYDLAVEEAFALLRYAARTSRRNLHELASEVVDRTGKPIPAMVIAVPRSARWQARAHPDLASLRLAQAERSAERARKLHERRLETL